MELDLEICRTIAIRYGLPLQFVFKEFHLVEVISQIAALAAQKPDSLVFKGGTALNKAYLQKTQRFSEDADFDLVTKNASEELSRFSKSLASSLKGYRITDFRRVRTTMQFYCMYETPLGANDHVRIDIAPKKLLTSRPVETNQIVSEFTHSSISGIKMYSIEDLTARKMNALATRTEGKDVYDVHMAFPMCSGNVLKTAIGLMLESEGSSETVDSFMRRMVIRLKKSDPKKMRNLTNPFIPAAHRPKSWEELKNDLLAKLEDFENSI
jgi:predicted nucleotidyltransferase component of viral defense system